MTGRGLKLLKVSFAIGVVADAVVAVNWFLIAAGAQIPNSLSGMVGTGVDYRFAMYIAGVFMAGWAVILAWGWLKPLERKGLLLITAAFILLSVLVEVAHYLPLLGGSGFVVGVMMRSALIAIFSFSYFYARVGSAKAA